MPIGSLGVEIEALRKHLEFLEGERHPYLSPERLREVEDYIAKEIVSYGLSLEEDFFSFLGARFRNLLAYSNPPGSEPFYLIGAHYDSVEGSPGADDNASGVAALLEIARVLSKTKPKAPVVFAFFNLEEFNMIGSSHYASLLKKKKANLLGMISLEMIGYTDKRRGAQKYPPGFQFFYPSTGDFVGVVANTKSRPFLKKVTTALKGVPGLPVETICLPLNGLVVPASRLSDHSPFWDHGYPALLVTDTSFYRNPHYHGPTDTVATLDLEFLKKVTEGIAIAVTGEGVSLGARF